MRFVEKVEDGLGILFWPFGLYGLYLWLKTQTWAVDAWNTTSDFFYYDWEPFVIGLIVGMVSGAVLLVSQDWSSR